MNALGPSESDVWHQIGDAFWSGLFLTVIGAIGGALRSATRHYRKQNLILIDIKQVRQHIGMDPFPYDGDEVKKEG